MKSSHNTRRSRAIFLDRDGVINEILFHQEMGVIETPFTPGQFRLRPRVGNAVALINRLGYKAIIISNQPGVAMRHFSKGILGKMDQKMIRLLKKDHAFLDDIFYCLHHPTKGQGPLKRKCRCRKPRPGLFYKAKNKWKIDLKKSYMIGDSILDVQAGRKAGCKTILLAHLKCDLCHLMARRGIKPHYMAKDLFEAVRLIRKLEA